jgi:DNA repair exonuclease SbcCD ATPase subunit
MKRQVTAVVLLVWIVFCCGYCALLWIDYRSRSRRLERLQLEVSQLGEVREQHKALQKAYAELEELERLRQNHFELGELTLKIAALRRAQAQRKMEAQQAGGEQIRKLELENAQLRAELEQKKAAPGAIEDRLSVDGSELQQIGYFFRAYAKNNSGKYPADFGELRYYLPATVYPSIETNRFEILSPQTDANSDPNQQALVRSRFQDDQNARLYLFADGHLETRRAP